MNNISRREFLKFIGATGAFIALNKNFHIIDSLVDKILPEDNIIERARQELKEKGITKEQAKAYTILSDLLYKYIKPFGYDLDLHWVQLKHHSQLRTKEAMPGREAAWKMYLGIPLTKEERKYFDISETRPSIEKNPPKYYYSLPHKEERILQLYNKYNNWTGVITVQQAAQIAYYGEQDIYCKTKDHMIFWDDGDCIMGKFKVSKGEDKKGEYISYYDVWNLEPEGFSLTGLVGKPFEIYDRIYLNKKEKYNT